MIFGIQHAKFIHQGTTVLLKYSNMDPVYAVPDEITHKSIMNGHKSFITLGDYAEFTIRVHLWKYTVATDGKSPKDKFNELWGYNHITVDEFFPHKEGFAVKDYDGNSIPFRISSVVPGYLQIAGHQVVDYDLVTMTFTSSKYVDLSKISFDSGITLLTEDGSILQTEDGKTIQI